MAGGRPFPKGQSGNPKGRPPKGRALTDLLEKALAKTVPAGPDGSKVARKALMAERVAEAVATGWLTLPHADGTEVRLPLGGSDWRDLVKWVYTHVDGAKVLNEHTGKDGEPLPAIELRIINAPQGDGTGG